LHEDGATRQRPVLGVGRSGSDNNALYRKFGMKQRSNEAMRADHVARALALVEDERKLKLPAAEAA
jgi:hypothetical protein